VGRYTKVNPVVYFDGVCNLCNGAVRFIIKRDSKGLFRFAPLQLKSGIRVNEKLLGNTDTIALLDQGRFYVKSTAVLRIIKRLDGIWPLFYVAVFLPKSIRDWLYDRVAKNRYRLFGKRDVCMIPNPELKSRFIAETLQ